MAARRSLFTVGDDGSGFVVSAAHLSIMVMSAPGDAQSLQLWFGRGPKFLDMRTVIGIGLATEDEQ